MRPLCCCVGFALGATWAENGVLCLFEFQHLLFLFSFFFFASCWVDSSRFNNLSLEVSTQYSASEENGSLISWLKEQKQTQQSVSVTGYTCYCILSVMQVHPRLKRLWRKIFSTATTSRCDRQSSLKRGWWSAWGWFSLPSLGWWVFQERHRNDK